MRHKLSFLPVNEIEMKERGWAELDFLYISGDAYVDHPSFGHAIITRLLEKEGFHVGIIPQPDWRDNNAFTTMGKPRLAVLISSGVIDSMVNHYTAAKKPRSEDLYSPGGKSGYRPDRAVIAYCNKIREVFGDVPIIIGGIEASLRRFAHYDYWDNNVRRSILMDSNADLLIYGMGERPILEIAKLLEKGVPIRKIKDVEGTAFIAPLEELPNKLKEFVSNFTHNSSKDETNTINKQNLSNYKELSNSMCLIPAFEEVLKSKKKYAEAFKIQYFEQDNISGRILIQPHKNRFLVQNKPTAPLSEKEMDKVYSLQYERTYHPMYEKLGGIPAIREVEFSITSHRGCFGGCSFCALNFHQGRVIQKRSKVSIVNEARNLTHLPNFKGYIHDVGGPTANFRNKSCKKQETKGVCKDRQCLYPKPCNALVVDHSEYLGLLKDVRELPKVKKVFIRSGIRYDYLMLDKNESFFHELCKHHISGQLKVAPEHICEGVLMRMGKPGKRVYDSFVEKYKQINSKLGKEQYLVPYLVSSHPGSDMKAAVELAEYLRDIGYMPEQVQDFYPTPGTLSTSMFYTGIDPRDMSSVYVPKDSKEKSLQRALLQYRKKENYRLVAEALKIAGREDLIGFGKNCLIKPLRSSIIGQKNNKNIESTTTSKREPSKKSNLNSGKVKERGLQDKENKNTKTSKNSKPNKELLNKLKNNEVNNRNDNFKKNNNKRDMNSSNKKSRIISDSNSTNSIRDVNSKSINSKTNRKRKK